MTKEHPITPMTQEHPITPSQQLVGKWVAMLEYCEDIDVFTDVARWGADQELDAVLTWLRVHHFDSCADALLAARCPKPQSLKEQALGALENLNGECLLEGFECPEKVAIIRRALESLPDQ